MRPPPQRLGISNAQKLPVLLALDEALLFGFSSLISTPSLVKHCLQLYLSWFSCNRPRS